MTVLLQPPPVETPHPVARPAAPVRNRWSHLTHLPRASTAIAAAIGVALSVFPSRLPHDPFTQGVVTTLLVAVAVAIARPIRRASAHFTGRVHQVVLWICAGVVAASLVAHQLIEGSMRTSIGLHGIGIGYWLCMAAASGATLLLGHICRLAWRHRRRLWRTGLILAVILAYFSPISPANAQTTLSVPTASSERPLEHRSPVGAVRAYAEQRPGESVQAQADRVADQFVARGGLRVDHVVIAIPTGSGWIDPAFVKGLEGRFGSDVATVGMQYDDLPSWMSYLLHQDDADAAARALFRAISHRIDRLPPSQRPQLHVYGESLGATAGQSIFTGSGGARARSQVCSVLWVGTPGGAKVGLPRETSVTNADDPVVHTHPSDLWSPSGDGRPWLPVVSYVQSGADLIDALLMPDGHGHKYGPRQADSLQTCE